MALGFLVSFFSSWFAEAGYLFFRGGIQPEVLLTCFISPFSELAVISNQSHWVVLFVSKWFWRLDFSFQKNLFKPLVFYCLQRWTLVERWGSIPDTFHSLQKYNYAQQHNLWAKSFCFLCPPLIFIKFSNLIGALKGKALPGNLLQSHI